MPASRNTKLSAKTIKQDTATTFLAKGLSNKVVIQTLIARELVNGPTITGSIVNGNPQIILQDPDGGQWLLEVDNQGVLSTSSV